MVKCVMIMMNLGSRIKLMIIDDDATHNIVATSIFQGVGYHKKKVSIF